MKRFSIFMIFLASIFLFSCSQESKNGSLSLSMNVPSSIFSQKESSRYTLKVALTGDYEDDQKKNILENKTETFFFSGIPEGSNITVTVSLFLNDEKVKEGETKTTIKSGQNEIKIKLKTVSENENETETESSTTEEKSSGNDEDEDESLWVILWNRAEKEQMGATTNSPLTQGFQFFDSLNGGEKIESSISMNVLENFCFAPNGDLYALEFYVDETGAQVYQIGEYIKGENGYKSGEMLFNLYDLMSSANAGSAKIVDMASDGKNVYLMWTSDTSNETIIASLAIEKLSDSNLQNFDRTFTASNVLGQSLFVENEKFYIATSSAVYEYDSPTAASTNLTYPNDASLSDFTGNGVVTDLILVNNNLYALYAYNGGEESRGGIIKIDVKNVMTAEDFKIGDIEFSYPVRFICAKGEKIAVADDGVLKNRVIKIDLEKETALSKEVGVMFDREFDGSDLKIAEIE